MDIIELLAASVSGEPGSLEETARLILSTATSASLVWTTPWECRPALTSVATTLQQRMEPHLLHLIMLQLHLIMPQHRLHPTTPTPPAALWLFPTPGPISRPRRMIRSTWSTSVRSTVSL